MRKTRASSHAISGVFVFLLLGIFALMATVMVLLGVRAYRGTVERSGVHANERIAAAYLRGKLRAADEAGGFRVETREAFAAGEDGETVSLGPVETLVLSREMHYVTRYYVYGGVLRRDFADESAPFEPQGGAELCDAGLAGEGPALTARREGGSLVVTLAVSGATNLPAVETLEGLDTVLLSGWGAYETGRLYVWNGSLMRQGIGGEAFDPARGEVLCPAASMTAVLEPGSVPLDENGGYLFDSDGSVIVHDGTLTLTIEADPADLDCETLNGVQTVVVRHAPGAAQERVTRLFVWDGHLCESAQDPGEAFDPTYGEPVCEALALELLPRGSLTEVRLQMPGGDWLEFNCAMRSPQ